MRAGRRVAVAEEVGPLPYTKQAAIHSYVDIPTFIFSLSSKRMLGGLHVSAPPRWAISDPCSSSHREHCYGELTRHGLRRLLSILPPACSMEADSVVYDVGSGFGRIAAAIRARTNVSRVIGVEVSGCRARAALKRYGGRVHGLTLQHADIRDVGFADATHLYLTSQCWQPSLLTAIFGMHAPRLRCIIDVGSLDALAAQHIAAFAAAFGPVRSLARQISGTWDEHAAALFVTRGECNATCVSRAQERIEQASQEAEDTDRPGPMNPWRRPIAHAALDVIHA